MNETILAAVDDMFFASKIRAVAETTGAQVRFVRSVSSALEAARANLPRLVIADLHSERCDPLALGREFKADPTLQAIPLIGFFSHVDVSRRDAAAAAGYDRVMPRSAFTNNLANILTGEN